MSLTRKSFLLVWLVLFPAAWSVGQVVNEKLEVVNVEVPVRVFLDGKPLDTLGKSDFQLYEGDDLQEINGFSLRRKKLITQQITIQEGREAVALPARYFVLVFRILEYNRQLQRGIEYFFSDILRDQDQLLILVNDRTLVLNQDIWQIKRQEILEQVLREEAVRASQELEAYFVRVGQDIDQNRLRAQMERNFDFSILPIINLLQRYLEAWQEFKIKYLAPDLDKFYNFARHLKKIKAEKWVLSFYQVQMFPKMKISGPLRRQMDDLIGELSGLGAAATQFARVISRLLDEIDRELNFADEFPAEQIGKMLLHVNTTYHCFISRVEREGLSEDLEYKKVASDMENSLREITRRSGGSHFIRRYRFGIAQHRKKRGYLLCSDL